MKGNNEQQKAELRKRISEVGSKFNLIDLNDGKGVPLPANLDIILLSC